MRNNKAVSMISLIITIVIMIIIASISVSYFADVLDDALFEKARVELKDVETVVEKARVRMTTNDFIPNESYVITSDELDEKFGTLLSQEEIQYIKDINNNSPTSKKYYLMNQERFDNEFKNDINAIDLSSQRDYLINYNDSTVIINYGGTRITNAPGDTIIKANTIERGSIRVTFDQRNSSTWLDKQVASATIVPSEGVTNYTARYLWSQMYTEPTKQDFENGVNSGTYTSGSDVYLEGVTGNDWYLWLEIDYVENNNSRTEFFRSEPFFLDKDKPSAILDVDEITR